MNKIVLFYGPKIGFEKLLEEQDVDNENRKTLLELVRLDDESRRIYFVSQPDQEMPNKKRIEVKNLVSFSDEYASIQEHAILNFDRIISDFSIENMFLHNPPQVIAKKMEIVFPNIIEIKRYQYKQINEKKIYDIHSNFESKIVGQLNAKQSLLRTLVQLTNKERKKPVVILFYGPSGVGKTETAKYLAEILGGELFRRQFSMFQNNDYATYLFGGQHKEKCFAKEVLEREANVLLLDEFDKANPVFHSAFYQLFDEGIFEDKNYIVNVGNAIIICTSNYLSENEIKKHLGDPIFSRFETCIEYEELSPDSVKKIIKRCIESEWEKLSDDDKELVDKVSVENNFNNYLNKIKNVRKIDSLVRQVIYDEILKRIISDNENKTKKIDKIT